MGIMMPITGAIFDKYGAKRLAITDVYLDCRNLTICFLNKRYTDFAYHHSLWDSDVRDLNGDDASNDFRNECLTWSFDQSRYRGKQYVPSSSQLNWYGYLDQCLTNVTKGNLPSDSLLDATPLAYKEKQSKRLYLATMPPLCGSGL